MVGIKRFKLIIGIFIFFLSIFLMSHNNVAHATKVVSGGIYGYNINDGSGSTSTWSTPLPAEFLSGSLGFTKYLYGYNVTGTLYNEFSGSYATNIAKITTRLQCSSSSSTSGCVINEADTTSITGTSHNGSSLSGSCVLTSLTSYYSDYTCSLMASSYDYPETFSLTIGNTTIYTGNPVAVSCGGSACFSSSPIASILLQSVTFDLISTQDPNTVLLQEQINQNQQIIDGQNQNTQNIIDNQNQNTEDIIRSNQNCHESVNKLNIPDEISQNLGVKWVVHNNTALLSGTPTNFYSYSGSGRVNFASPLPAGTYTFSIAEPISYRVILAIFDQNNNEYQYNIPIGSTKITFTTDYSMQQFRVGIRDLIVGTPISVTISNMQLEAGLTVSPYESPSSEEVCINVNEQYYDEQRQADQNISNQSTSDIEGTENQATTNLIGVLSGFISTFSNINATNCNLTLEFPNFAGGTRVVNICQGKEKAPRIVEIGSSLLLIGVFVPLAYILIKMIYNEIRSWTNG